MNDERWRELTYWPLLFASILFIIAYSWAVIADLQGTAELVARGIMGVTWAFFVIDYVVRLSIASPRAVWFRHHIFDLLIVILPALKPLRLLKAFTSLKFLHRTAGAALRSRISIYGAGAAIILIWVAGLAVLDAERGAPGANIETFGDAIWWAFVTVTTVGYGDYYPVTPTGRTVAVFLMAGGVAVVGIVTATLASWVLERAAQRSSDDDEPATRHQIRELSRQLAALSNGGGEPPTK